MTLLFLSCQPEPLEFSTEMNACTNLDFDNPDDSELEIEEVQDDLLIRRTNVFKSSTSVFEPTYMVDGYKVFVREYWVDETQDQFCWEPILRIKNHPNDFLEFWWYIGDSDISMNVLQYDPK